MESDGETSSPPRPHACGAGHPAAHSLPTSAGGRVCLSCAAALLSSASAPSHHVSHALASLSLALADPAFLAPLRAAHPRLLAAPLAEAVAVAAARRDAALAAQASDLAADLASAVGAPATSELVARLARVLSSGSLVKHLHTLHCLGVLLNSTKDAAAYIGDKLSLFLNLVNDLRLPSDEIRGEILFVLYKLSLLNATPWDNICHTDNLDLSEVGRSLIQLSLEILLKTQNDAVRLNCIAFLLTLARKEAFDILLLSDQSPVSSIDAEESMNASIIVLFADAVKGSLLSTNLEVQTGTLNLIFQFISSDAKQFLVQTLVDEDVADYVFEILRLSGNNDPLVISSIKVLSILATSEERFKEKLAIGFSTLLPVLHYVAEIPFHPVQSEVLQLVSICIVNCSGILSLSQEEQITSTLTAILRRNGKDELGMCSETFILVCSILVEILRSPCAHNIQKLPSFIEEASKHAISLTLPHVYDRAFLVPHSLLLLKEALIFCLEGNEHQISGKRDLEDSIVETCETYLLHWLESAVADCNDDETVAEILLQIFQIIFSRTSENNPLKFAQKLASSSWFSLSFGLMGLFPTDHVKSVVYLVTSSVVDKVLGCKYGGTIRDAYVYLPSDPAELMYLLGQCSTEDFNLASCQCAILVMLYACSFYNERLVAFDQILASVEQYILLNGGKFPYEINGSLMLTLLVHLYAFARGISVRCSISHSPEAERTLFRVMACENCDWLSIRVHPVALKWLFQKGELMGPLSFQMLNFCRTFCENKTAMLSNGSQLMDIQMVAELAFSGETSISSLLVSLFSQIVKEGTEDEIFSVANVIAEILVIFPCSSDQFTSCGVVDAMSSIYCSPYSSRIRTVCSYLIFNILNSTTAIFCQEDEWLALTMKLLECFNCNLDCTSNAQEQKILIGILCLILHHSANGLLIEPAKAIILNNSLVSLTDGIIKEACAKGPSLFQHSQETHFGEILILILQLVFFSLRSLHAILEESIDWQDFLQRSDNVQSFSVLGVPCHDLCRLMHFGPYSIKLIASQCLLELLTRISYQRSCFNAELRCSARYMKSVIAVIEGLVFCQDSRIAENCGACLSMILGWEKFGSQEKAVVRESKWSRLIMEEFAVALTAPGLTSKSFSNQQKFAANIAVSLLKLSQVPGWLTSLFDDSLISGIVSNLSARNVTAEVVKLFSELMARKYLTQEHIVALHNLFQVCRRQVYEGSSKAPSSEQKAEKVARSTDDVQALLFGLILNQCAGPCTVQMEQQKLLCEIDSFFQESSQRERR